MCHILPEGRGWVNMIKITIKEIGYTKMEIDGKTKEAVNR